MNIAILAGIGATTLFLLVVTWFLWEILKAPIPEFRTHSARILLHSKCSATGKEVITWEQVHGSIVHAEFMTHRTMSRNTSSLRAIPTMKILAQVWHNPFTPIWWGKNQAGMQAREELTGWRLKAARFLWMNARFPALFLAWACLKVGLHKQLASRILSPWVWMVLVVTATELDNYFDLRDDDDAQPEIALPARSLRAELKASTPQILRPGEWHIPFSNDLGDLTLIEKIRVSSGRAARTSYLNHNGIRSIEDDLALYNKLLGRKPHMSPFEHACKALPQETPSGNFVGWKQFRKYVEDKQIDSIMEEHRQSI